MPVECLIHAVDHSKAGKGFIQDVRNVSDLTAHPWGNRESLPDYVILAISDVTKDQVDNYTDNWKNELTYELLGSNTEGRRYKISVNLKIISAFGVDKGVRDDLKGYMISAYGAVVVDHAFNNESITLDIPNPLSVGWTLYVKQIREVLLDQFEEQVDTRRYIFNPADVDIAIAAGVE